LIIGAALKLDNATSIILATALSFVSGYSLSTRPVVKMGVPFLAALSVVLAADTLSIIAMEVTDNIVMLAIPGAMNAGLNSTLYWESMAVSLAAAFVVALPVNAYLLKKGRGHALVAKYHDHES
jgi:hypothetical protein